MRVILGALFLSLSLFLRCPNCKPLDKFNNGCSGLINTSVTYLEYIIGRPSGSDPNHNIALVFSHPLLSLLLNVGEWITVTFLSLSFSLPMFQVVLDDRGCTSVVHCRHYYSYYRRRHHRPLVALLRHGESRGLISEWKTSYHTLVLSHSLSRALPCPLSLYNSEKYASTCAKTHSDAWFIILTLNILMTIFARKRRITAVGFG